MATFRQHRVAVSHAAFLPLLVALTGCGGLTTSDVSGKLTLKGAAPNIDGLTISFLGANGRPVTILVAGDGSYKATNVPAGEVKVGFTVASFDPPAFLRDQPKEGETWEEFEKRKNDPSEVLKRKKMSERISKAKAVTSLIPTKYGDPLKSGIATTLQPGSDNTFDFDIK